MAKSKNHTNHNQNFKAHRNGIKKPKFCKKFSMRGIWAPLRRNTHFSVKHNKGAKAQMNMRLAKASA
ncbi:Ribosomal protein L29e [Perkinsela sp. CCAP 1560/4]|nr:Ribosomal protein L29e [Perkinsela sp. CCAP 1560/4]|eukprot:KNH06528.1 Ribosomal protein L29e [Perkinsela sp. CCAP 1560/4]